MEEFPIALKEMTTPPRTSIPKDQEKDAQTAAFVALGRSTVAEQAARIMGELDVYNKKDDDYKGLAEPYVKEGHSKEFGEVLGKHLSGHGMKHDPLDVSAHMLQVLRGGGIHTADLLHTYVMGKVPSRRQQPRHSPVTSFQSEPNLFAGGSTESVIGHTEGSSIPRNHIYPSHIEVV